MFSLHSADISSKTRMLLLHYEPSYYFVQCLLTGTSCLVFVHMHLFSFRKDLFQKHLLRIDGITLCSSTPSFFDWILYYAVLYMYAGFRFELVWIARFSVLCRIWYILVIVQTFLTWRMWLWTIDSDVAILWWRWWWGWWRFVVLSYCRSGSAEDWWQWSNVTSSSKDHERIRTGLVNILLDDSWSCAHYWCGV